MSHSQAVTTTMPTTPRRPEAHGGREKERRAVGVALVAVVVDVPLFSRLTTDGSQTDAAMELVKFLVAVPVGALVGGWVLRWVGDGLSAGVGLALVAGRSLPGALRSRGALEEAGGGVAHLSDELVHGPLETHAPSFGSV